MGSTFGDLLPPLRRLAGLRLASPLLRPYWVAAGGLPELTAVSGTRIDTVGDLIGLSPDRVTARPGMAVPLLRVLARVSSDVFDLLDQAAAAGELDPATDPSGFSGLGPPSNSDPATSRRDPAPTSPGTADASGEHDWVRELVIRRSVRQSDGPLQSLGCVRLVRTSLG